MDPINSFPINDRSFQKAVFAGIVFTAIVIFIYRSLFTVQYPRELPRFGQREGKSWKEVKKRFQTDSLSLLNDVYNDYSRKGQSVLIPTFGLREEIIVPPTSLHWLTGQPDRVLSSLAAQIDAIQLDCSLGSKFAHDPWGGMLLKKNLNGVLEILLAIMNEQLGPAVDSYFGEDSNEWKEVDLFPACRAIAGRAVLSFTLGDSEQGRKLCSDDDFVKSCYAVLDGMLDTAGFMGMTRRALRPLLGRWASRAMPSKIKDLSKRFEPLYRERMQIIEQQAEKGDAKVPRDLIQMMLEYAAQERPDEASSLDDMTGRLAVLNFGTMHQTVITLHNLFLDVLDSDREHKTISVLDDEVTRVIGESKNSESIHWTKAKLAAMTKADSVARETLRVHTFLGKGSERFVLAKEGVVTEDGIRLPPGSRVSILAYQSQTDPDTFKNPLTYDPFRFSREREAAADQSTGKPGLNNLSFASTSADYLPFGHGRHACPGRFMVDYEFKMTLAYTIRNYDLEFPESYSNKRPPNVWMAGFGIPPLDAKIRIKRKRVTGVKP